MPPRPRPSPSPSPSPPSSHRRQSTLKTSHSTGQFVPFALLSLGLAASRICMSFWVYPTSSEVWHCWFRLKSGYTSCFARLASGAPPSAGRQAPHTRPVRPPRPAIRDGCSYLEVTKNSPVKLGVAPVSAASTDWLGCCVMAHVLHIDTLPKLASVFRAEGISSFHPLGGDRILIPFGSVGERRAFLDNGSRQLSSWITDVLPWVPGANVGDGRFAWLSLFRVPPDLCEMDFFAWLCSSIGALVMVDPLTDGKVRLDSAFVLVSTVAAPGISATLQFLHLGRIFTVQVREFHSSLFFGTWQQPEGASPMFNAVAGSSVNDESGGDDDCGATQSVAESADCESN